MYLLGIESSCDETAVSVVEEESGRLRIASMPVASQIETHKLYGGVVPEIASRAHTEAISALTVQALDEAGITAAQLDVIGVTSHPGLIGALLVGVNFAKSLAFAQRKPLVGVNHIRGHVAANYFAASPPKPPFLALITSGGHTMLTEVRSYTDYHTLGRTRDDAIGEAFDKVGRVIGLPYPGGAEMDRLASLGDPHAFRFPSAAVSGDTLDFSFSGLKTAVINQVHTAAQRGETVSREDLAASFTAAVTGAVVQRTEEALDRSGLSSLVLAGGVAANSHLRGALQKLCEARQCALFLPPRSLCGDNAAMIAAQTYYEYLAGNRAGSDLNACALYRE